MIFGVPVHKDAEGSEAWNPGGIAQRAISALREEFGDDAVVMSDLCLDEYTDHGHCGVLNDRNEVDNDATVERYRRVAVAQAEAGTHGVGPSGMMDGQVGEIRSALDAAGHDDVVIMAYAAKTASAFYGPFRDAAGSTPAFGDRRGSMSPRASYMRSVCGCMSASSAATEIMKTPRSWLTVTRVVVRRRDAITTSRRAWSGDRRP